MTTHQGVEQQSKGTDEGESLQPREELLGYRSSMNAFRIRPHQAALVMVDLQYGSAASGYGFQAMFESIGHGDVVQGYMQRIEEVVLPSVQALLRAFRSAGGSVVYLTIGSEAEDYSDMLPQFRRAVDHFRRRGIMIPYARTGTREIQIRDEIRPQSGEAVLRKRSAGAFATSKIHELLQERGISQTIITGVATNYCVQSTLRGAADRGYDCVIVEDACADVTFDMHEVGIKSMAPFGRVMQASAVCDEVLS